MLCLTCRPLPEKKSIILFYHASGNSEQLSPETSNKWTTFKIRKISMAIYKAVSNEQIKPFQLEPAMTFLFVFNLMSQRAKLQQVTVKHPSEIE